MHSLSSPITTLVFMAGLLLAVYMGARIRRLLPDHHVTGESKDTVKVSIGLIATMSALLLGLLVSSAKSSYDDIRGSVLQIASKVNMLDRVLAVYGPEADDVRAKLHGMVSVESSRMWSEGGARHRVAPDTQAGAATYAALQQLSPRDEAQRSLKAEAVSLALQIAELRSLVLVGTAGSISLPLLAFIAAWFIVIFLGFSIMAPPNPTVYLSLAISAVSVSVAIFLILELDRPFDGMIRIPSELLVNALAS